MEFIAAILSVAGFWLYVVKMLVPEWKDRAERRKEARSPKYKPFNNQ